MFEQTFVRGAESARKPYLMGLSMVLQMSVIAGICLLPFVFTQALPSLQVKSVLAAPHQAREAVKMKQTSAALVVNAPRTFRFVDFQARAKQPLTEAGRAATPPDVGDVGGDPNAVPFGVFGDAEGPLPQAPPARSAILKPSAHAGPAVRLGGVVAAANLIHQVQPVYPPMARSVRVQRVVEFTATISKEGAIEHLQLVRGHPLLVNAAREAVLQWRYRPTLLNGQPVEVITDIVVNFTLSE